MGVLLAATFIFSPLASTRLPLDRKDAPQELARDLAYWLRGWVGEDGVTVFSSPNATTWLSYFGGFRGIGTLYWENLDGLAASTAIYTAPSADSARVLLRARGITHVVVFSWDQGPELLRAVRADVLGRAPDPPGFVPAVTEALRQGESSTLPAWLVPLPYPAPAVGGAEHPSAVVFEVMPDQSAELSLVRLAQYYQAIGEPDRIEGILRSSLAVRPGAPAWALLAQLQAARSESDAFAETLRGLRGSLGDADSLEVGDRINAAVALAVGRDRAGAAQQLEQALRDLDERRLRRLSSAQLSFLVTLSRQLGLEAVNPAMVIAAESRLPPSPRP